MTTSTIRSLVGEIVAAIEAIVPTTALGVTDRFLQCYDIESKAATRNFDIRIKSNMPAEGQTFLAGGKYVEECGFQVRVYYTASRNPTEDSIMQAEDGTAITRALLSYDYDTTYQGGIPQWLGSEQTIIDNVFIVTHSFNVYYQEA